MPPIRRFGLIDWLLLLLVLALAGGARAGYLVTCADGSRTGGPLRVQDDHSAEIDALVHNLSQHKGFVAKAPFSAQEETTAHVSPGYPHVLALLAAGMDADRRDSAVRWGQCVLGALTVGLYFLFARRAFRSLTVGFLVGLLTAAYPFWIINTAEIGDGVLASFLLAGSLFLGGRASQTGGAFASLLFGLALAALALVRAALLPFAFVAIIWFLLRTRNLRRGWLAALLAFLGFANGLAPWTVRNLQLLHEPVPIVDSAYLHLWIGNNPRATGGPADAETFKLGPAEEQDLASRPQPQRYDELGKKVVQEVREEPVETVRRRIAAALMFLLGEDWFRHNGEMAERTGRASEEGGMPDWLEQAYPMTLQATILALLALAFLGWRWSYGWRWESMPMALAMTWLPLPYVLGHAEALSGPRLPLDGVLLCYAAFALASVLPRLGTYLREARGAGELPQDVA